MPTPTAEDRPGGWLAPIRKAAIPSTEPCVELLVPVHATRQTQFLEGRQACRQSPESADVSSAPIWLVGLRLAPLIYPGGATGTGAGQGKDVGGARELEQTPHLPTARYHEKVVSMLRT